MIWRRTIDRSPALSRRAVIAIEFLVAFPVALGMVLAIAQFGILLAKVQYVEMAAFEAAFAAARLEQKDWERAPEVARRRANRILRTAGLGDSCAVVVSHNVSGRSAPTVRNPGIRAVRCTVCVPMSQLTPDLLSLIGFSTKNRLVNASHTVPYLHRSRMTE